MRITLERAGRTAQVDTYGGELASYRDGSGLEYIWQGDPAYWPGRNPLLFPAVGALRGGTARFAGKEYPMERHGFARRREFTVVERGEDLVVLELREDPGTLAAYPFPFRLQVRQRLLERGFSTAVTVYATGGTQLPFCLGAHTAFRCPLHPGERFEDYQVLFERVETCPSLVPEGGCLDRARTVPGLEGTDTLELDYAPFDRLDTLIFEGLRSRSVSLRHRETGRGVRVDFTGFPVLALWTMPGKRAPYLCIEPWHGMPAVAGEGPEFADKAHCICLAPGQAHTLEYRVETLED